MPTGRLGLGPSLEELEERLDALSDQELRARLLAHGERLPSVERADFLTLFSQDAGERVEDPADHTLVTDVDAFVADIESGLYVDGWGYDRDYGDHRAFGDESWTLEFDHLVDRGRSSGIGVPR